MWMLETLGKIRGLDDYSRTGKVLPLFTKRLKAWVVKGRRRATHLAKGKHGKGGTLKERVVGGQEHIEGNHPRIGRGNGQKIQNTMLKTVSSESGCREFGRAQRNQKARTQGAHHPEKPGKCSPNLIGPLPTDRKGSLSLNSNTKGGEGGRFSHRQWGRQEERRSCLVTGPSSSG